MLAENPDATLDDLLAVMPGPDFPTGGIVVDPEELPDAYARGQGTFRLQGKYHIEQLPGNLQAIVVTELPYGVSPDQIVAEVVRAARAEKITDVTEMPKNLSDRNGMRVQIRCKRGGNVTKLVADLMRHTSLRVTIGINLTVVADGVPRQLDLREIVDRFVSFRFEVVTKRLEHERNELLRELHRLVALLAALDAIDARDPDRARTPRTTTTRANKLKSELRVELHGNPVPVPIDDEQAQYILDMPIKRLSRLNRFKLAGGARGEGPRASTRSGASSTTTTSCARSWWASCARPPRSSARRGGRCSAARRGSPPARRPAPPPAGRTSRSSPRRAPTWCCSPPAAAPAPRARSTAASRGCRSTSGAGDAVATAVFTDTESELNAYTSDGQVLRLRVADVPIESRVSRGTKAVALVARLRPRRRCCRWRRPAGTCCSSPSGARSSAPRPPCSRARTWADRPPSTCPTATAWSPSSPTATATRSCCTRRTAARCGSMPARCGP